MSTLDLTGLSLFRKPNPYERRAVLGMKMMQQSGFAAPLVAAATGASLGQAEQYDVDQEEKGLQLLKEKREQEMGQKEVENCMKLVAAGKLPEATAWWAKIRESYPGMNLPDIQFNSVNGKEIKFTSGKDGQQYVVDTGLMEQVFQKIQANPNDPVAQDPTYGGAILPVGGKADDKREKETEIGAGGDMVTKAVYDPKNPKADENGYVAIGKPYPKHAKSVAGPGGGGSSPLKSHQTADIRREVGSIFLPYVKDDIKKEIGDIGGEANLGRLRAGLDTNKRQLLDRMHEEMEDMVGKGTPIKKAANQVRKKYAGQLDAAAPTPAPADKTPAANPAGLSFGGVANAVKGVFTPGKQTPTADQLKDLPPGKARRFSDGSVWTLDENGNPKRVQ